MTKFLSMNVDHDSDTKHMTISHQTVIDTTLRRFAMDNAKSVPNSISSGLHIESDDAGEALESPYSESIGVLLYISNTIRPLISFAVERLAR